MVKNKLKILIIVGGPKHKVDSFIEPAKKLGIDLTTASFYDLNFTNVNEDGYVLKVKEVDVSKFDLVYIRVVGKRLEEATLLVNYLKRHKIPVVDKLYGNSLFIPSSISKSTEHAKLIEGGIPLPPTVFGSLFYLRDNAERLLGFPYVIKGTAGKKARDVWAPKTKDELEELIVILREREKKGESFFVQKLIHASQRVRVLVVGERAIGAVTRPTKWRKRWTKKVEGEYPEGIKESICPVPKIFSELAVKAAKAVDLDISGIDILEEDIIGKLYVIEANAAPSWNLIKKDTGINVEEEILKFLVNM
jgi:RimK family alpha-L-glutamate ligase